MWTQRIRREGFNGLFLTIRSSKGIVAAQNVEETRISPPLASPDAGEPTEKAAV